MKTAMAMLGALLVIALPLGYGLGWSSHTLALAFVSALLTVSVLALARRSMVPGSLAAAAGALALLYWGLSFASNLVEAAYFGVLPLSVAERGAVSSAVTAVLAGCILAWLLPAGAPQQARRVSLAGGLWWRLPLLSLCFFVLYLAAGIAVFPWIKTFYVGRPLPTLPQLFLLQCCRGLLDLVCVLPWLARYGGKRGEGAALSAALFTILCAWAPLLLPNAYLPPQIRFAHAMEMGGSSIVFGALAGWLLLKPVRAAASDSVTPTA